LTVDHCQRQQQLSEWEEIDSDTDTDSDSDSEEEEETVIDQSSASTSSRRCSILRLPSSMMSSKSSSARTNGTSSVHTSISLMHVLYCFDCIVESLTKQSCKPALPVVFNGEKFPLFVTWKKRHSVSSEWRLRGCIGTFNAKELKSGLREYASIAAFEDSRFTPIALSELVSLRCDVSLLTNFERASNLDDWKVGLHGVTLEFSDDTNRRNYSATFLPEVAKEQGWSRKQTIEELVAKSGYRGRINDHLRSRMKLTRYQSEKMGLAYEEYVKIRAERCTTIAPPPPAPITSSLVYPVSCSASPAVDASATPPPAKASSSSSSSSCTEKKGFLAAVKSLAHSSTVTDRHAAADDDDDGDDVDAAEYAANGTSVADDADYAQDGFMPMPAVKRAKHSTHDASTTNGTACTFAPANGHTNRIAK